MDSFRHFLRASLRRLSAVSVMVVIILVMGCSKDLDITPVTDQKAETRSLEISTPELSPANRNHAFIPSGFSPNGDGINDRFIIYGSDYLEEVEELRIYDRWGDMLFIGQNFPPNDYQYGWDGRFRGKMMNSEVFAYWAIVRLTNGEKRLYKGDLTLVR